MTGRPDGAPADDARVASPSRPAAIDLAAAILAVGGIFRLLAVALALTAPPEARLGDTPPAIAIVESAIQVLTIVVAVLVRFGRAWLVAANVVAVLAFLDIARALQLAGPVSLAFGILYSLAFVAIFVNKAWFDAAREHRRALAASRRA